LFPDHPPFISVWKTDNRGVSATRQISLPLVENGHYDFLVSWGDGTSSEIDSWDDPARFHWYAEAGIYTVEIIGEISGWQFFVGDI
jgi:hypothetical protein